MKPHLVYIDDEVLSLHGFRASFRRYFNIEVFSSPLKALAYIQDHQDIDIILSDQKMRELSGLELLEKVRDLYPQTMRILFSGYLFNEEMEKARNDNIFNKFFSKPLNDILFLEEMKKSFDLPLL